jgi:hypothetical protein
MQLIYWGVVGQHRPASGFIMGSLGFTLADRLGAKSVPCSVSGCSRTWIQMTGKSAKLGGRTEGNDSDPTSKMCDACRDKFRTLVDAQRPCDRSTCELTWTWDVQAQLEAFATRRPPPHRLCAADEAKLALLNDRQVPCQVPGCKRTWVFSRQAQLAAGAPDTEPVPTPAMCGPCANVYDKIADRPVTCGIRGCKKKWTWTRDEQIEDYAAGESNEPPRRLCESCKGIFGAIANREVRCRTSGCKNTWTWPREAQLDAAIADKPLPKAPHRMCQRCIDLYSSLKDVERPCRRAGCRRTWTDKRGAQLARAVRGKTGDPYPHYCAECEKEMGELDEQHVPCKTENCPGTWTWTAAQQLAAGVRPTPRAEADEAAIADGNGTPVHRASAASSDAASRRGGPGEPGPDRHAGQLGRLPEGAGAAAGAGSAAAAAGGIAPASTVAADHKRRRRKRRREIRPPDRRCDDCLTFLTDRKTKEIPCSGCKTPIHWPPESQLQTHLGNWAEPSLCGACKRDLTEAARTAEREALRHGGHVILSAAPPPEVVDAAAAAETVSASPATASAAPETPPVAPPAAPPAAPPVDGPAGNPPRNDART